ncbi:ubiquitin carboxyl-terminal hydrolase family [Stylonychia lemnae]|uniref:ubiquitinyl hydrolase 1 n=1 Tax=Stylonychia lemnae TaxID=5949 RepID=A0A078AUT4_STYLE|nr:ubiquitin carboxyl-terminal hydrolase family [Stylonychia lemnae]|eukprot:CDW85002.1 ubiquitin carboxyl-terminal hydrolase family [Stylonychia lemnae]
METTSSNDIEFEEVKFSSNEQQQDSTSIQEFSIDPEQFESYVEQLNQETKEFVSEYKSYKNQYFSALDDDVFFNLVIPVLQVYVINKKWFKQWKSFVCFKQVKKHYHVNHNYENLKRDYPGRINNEELLKDFSKYLRDDDLTDPANFTIKYRLSERFDYKLLPKKCWEILQNRFRGLELKRFKDTDFYNRKFIVKFPDIRILILPPLGQIDSENFPSTELVFIVPSDRFERLKEKILRCINLRREQVGQSPVENIRIWRANPYYSRIDRWIDFVKQYNLEGQSGIDKFTEQQKEIVMDQDIEENTGVEFPGQQFDSFLNKTYSELDKSNNSINSNYDLIIVEVPNQNNKYMFRYNKNPGSFGKCENCYQTRMLKVVCPCKKVSYCDEKCRSNDEKYHLPNCDAESQIDFDKLDLKPMPNARNGVVGLQNLGNTCFMNSALQCLSNSWPLTRFFLDKHFASQVNEDNPLGTKGQVAFHFAKLLNELWNRENDTFSPNMLKRHIGKQNPMFSGYQQHDSQEFLNFLLDTLHEDLNRVQKKPYVELKDSDNRSDAVVATEHWEGHLQRNMSIIVDLFQGQYKSTLQCPQCKRVSITFDPYMSIPLPIPLNFQLSYYFLPDRVSKKIYRFDVFIRMSYSVLDAKQIIAKQASEYYQEYISPYEFILAQVSKSDFAITQLFKDSEQSGSLNINFGSNFIFAYQIDKAALNTKVLPKVTDQQIKDALTLPFNQKVLDQDFEFDGDEEYKGDEPMKTQEEPTILKLDSIPLENLINPDWIFVPVMPVIRFQRQNSGNYYSYNNSSIKFDNKQAIPRLFWFNKNQPLADVQRKIVQNYSFAQDFVNEPEVHDPNEYYVKHYEKLLNQLQNNEDVSQDDLSQDITEYPFTINIVNQNQRYYAPPCRNCQSNCKNCPMPISSQKTFRDLLDQMVHKEKFFDNQNLFINQDEFKEQNDSDDDNNGGYNSYNNNIYSNKSKFKNNLQDDSDDDESIYNEEAQKKKLKQENRGRQKTFLLELVFVNRILREQTNSIASRLLTFDKHPREKQSDSYGYKSKKGSSSQQLSDCLDYFRHVEKLEKQNSWYCNKCQDHVEATKKIEIYTVPPLLILCLQRFKNKSYSYDNKLEDRIVFPIDDLDMTQFVVSKEQKKELSLLYDLYAVSNHYGSINFGHYTAYCKNYLNGKWYDFNDSSVSEVDSPTDVVSQAAYVLYYIRKDIKPNSLNFEQIQRTISDPEIMQKLTSKPPLITQTAENNMGSSLSNQSKIQGIQTAEINSNYIESYINDDERDQDSDKFEVIYAPGNDDQFEANYGDIPPPTADTYNDYQNMQDNNSSHESEEED